MPKYDFFQWPCDLAFCKIWQNTFCKIFLVLCTKLIFRCQKFVDERLISKGITLIFTYFAHRISCLNWFSPRRMAPWRSKLNLVRPNSSCELPIRSHFFNLLKQGWLEFSFCKFDKNI